MTARFGWKDKQPRRIVSAAVFLFLFFGSAGAAQLRWKDSLCVVVEETFEFCKPSPKWDTQETNEMAHPVKWVLHRGGANPEIKLSYDYHTEATSTFDFALDVKERLRARGIEVTSLKDRVIHGRSVSLITGVHRTEAKSYLVAAWKTAQRGIMLECTSAERDFASFEPHFMATVQSVKFLKN